MPRAQREQRILDAAEAEFGDRGFIGASMETIASGSEVTKALLYQYFESKEGLYTACIERARAQMFEELKRAAEGAPPGRMLTAIVDSYFDQLDATRASWAVLYGDAPARAVNGMRRRNADVIAELLRAGSSLTSDDADLAAQLIVGAGEQVGRWWLDRRTVSAEHVKRSFVLAIAGAIRGLEPG